MTRQDVFDAAQIAAYMSETACIGREILVLDEVDSTNTRIKREYAAQKQDGFTLIAHRQTAGRGRLGRSFASPAEDGLYFSVLLRPNLPPEQINFITTAAAVAVCRAIESVAGFAPGIKWVNDILMRGKKLCGILVEAGFTGGGTLDYAVLGIGVNLRFDPAVHPELADIAGGLMDFSDRTFGRAEIAAAILRELDGVYAQLCKGETAAVLDAYRDHLLGMGETITVHGTDSPWQATCVGLDAQGHLLVEDARGQHVLSTGEISIRLEEQKNVPVKV